MKKRILSLVLAVALLCSMAVAASAASVWKDGTYGGCSYSTVSSCYTNNWSCLIEWLNSSDSYTNYTFRADVTPYQADGTGSFWVLPPVSGNTSTRIGSNNLSPGYTLYGVYAKYYVNNSLATSVEVFAN